MLTFKKSLFIFLAISLCCLISACSNTGGSEIVLSTINSDQGIEPKESTENQTTTETNIESSTSSTTNIESSTTNIDSSTTSSIEEFDLIGYFFELIDQGNTDEAVDLLDSSVAPDENSKQQWKSAFDGFESVEVISKEPYDEQSWTDSYREYKVNLNIKIKPERLPELINWDGQSTRWISIIKSDDNWKIGTIATSP